jgi:hypothetical protein
MASVIVGSCGGGGASSPGEVNGTLAILPSAATLYAGVPYTFTVAGGRKPYFLSSTEPILLPVPSTLNGNSFQVVPGNPSVVDTGLDPNELPVRSVVITVRDSFGTTISTPSENGLRVAQNFLTGYGVVFTTTNCGQGETTPQACSGADSIVRLVATQNGLLLPNRAVRFCAVRGNFKFVVPETPSNVPATLVDCFDTVTDHSGVATARIRVPPDATTQIATLRVIDVASGAFVDQVFTIEQGTIVNQLTVIPNDFVFTGPRQGVCGTGSGDFIVFNGDPPYTAVSTNPNVTITPTSVNTNPARFTLSANNPFVCLDNVTVIVTDRANRRATVTVTTEEGSQTLPPLVVAPTTVSLNDTCGFTTSVTAVGGTGSLSTNSTHPRVQATLSGNTVTITRLRPDPPPPPAFYPNTAQVTVTDGTTIQTVTVNNVATFCP